MVKSISCKPLGAVIALLLLTRPSIAVPADAHRGGVLAKHWCAACHLVSPEQKTASSDVPSFASIARNKKLTPSVLKVFLSTSHRRMPDMHLSRTEIADIVAYIKSLDR